MSGIANYTQKSAIGMFEAGGKRYITVYNDSTAVLNGAVKVLSPKWITGIGVVMAMTAVATNATETNWVGIVANNPSGSIAASSYGNVLVMGKYGDASASTPYGAATSGSPAANAQLEILNGTTVFIDAGAVGGAVLVPEAVGIKIANVTTNVDEVYLFGKQVAIKAS